ncbi:MAG TPA: 2-oxoacid:ferredoxin oxidoreductase subunit beta [candidate division WOR-3 bacterium]|uniref:2-oxoacid:ferredoxin oxidoreductase subunit beta n=1 Tax=candidate division WOR-3 bacterium TaxID=2052148 RepID=A0A7C0VBI6_UNCW3|nr:2-oxoacid:ferredoxin oxidoreductase subunit beta [candidate division WOR-3 bacterium]
MVTEIARQYLRQDKFPSIWCPGCGHGIILGAILRTVHKLGIDKNKVMMVSGIGCSGRTPGYVDFHTLHTTHGRALTFATGIKLVRPEMTVLVVMGDGDAAAIGGNHFIHAARRNIDITAIVYNNSIYGMTGGQVSPTTPTGMYATTAPYGMLEKPFDIVELALGAGASFVARGSSYHVPMLDGLIKKAILHKGFSVVDVITTCPINFGRRNKLSADGAKNLKYVESIVVPLSKYQKMPEEERVGKFPIGIFRQEEGLPELTEKYVQLENKLRGEE